MKSVAANGIRKRRVLPYSQEFIAAARGSNGHLQLGKSLVFVLPMLLHCCKVGIQAYVFIAISSGPPQTLLFAVHSKEFIATNGKNLFIGKLLISNKVPLRELSSPAVLESSFSGNERCGNLN